MKKGLAPRNICFHSDLRKARDRTGFRRLVAMTSSGMGFARDDDDDICDSKHRLKGSADLA